VYFSITITDDQILSVNILALWATNFSPNLLGIYIILREMGEEKKKKIRRIGGRRLGVEVEVGG